MISSIRKSSLRGELLSAALLLTATVAGATEPCACLETAIYVRADSLQQTLLATRAHYREWLARQPAAREAVAFDPWLATQALPPAEADKLVRPAEGIDTAARPDGDQALWSPREDLIDGKAVKLVGGTGETAVYLTRTVRAKEKTRLTVGIGGGDQLGVWLGGQKVASACTHLTSGRYGCSYRVDGTRVDQVLVDLDLEAGENVLVVRVVSAGEASFYFSASPRPVPRLWEQVRRDFPAENHPMLDLVAADWFAEDGWLAARDLKREQELIDRLTSDREEASQPALAGPLPFFEAAHCGKDGAAVRAERDRLLKENIAPGDPRWLDLCVKASVLAKLRTELARLRLAVEELVAKKGTGPICAQHPAGRSGKSVLSPFSYPAAELLAKLDDYDRRLSAQAGSRLDPADEATRRLTAEMPKMQHEMLVDRNPLLRGAELLFVKRYTYNSKHFYDDFLHLSRFGGNLCVLSPADGSVREIVPQLAGGIFDRYDLSFDANRILFGYRRAKPQGFRIWQVGVDGSGLRQVTFPPDDEDRRIARYGRTSQADSWYGAMAYRFWTDDLHPCYLPDGGICFASTRCEHGVLCTPAHYLACTNLFRLDADGGGLRPLSQGALSEFTPTVMQDGRILYNRWEYVYKGIAAIQPLWTMRPDGSGTEEFYGDNVADPGVLWQARQVPGHARLAVCTGCQHEPLGVGQILLLDMNKSKRTPEPMVSLTPEVKTQNLRGLYQLRNGVWREDIYGPFYCDPYPLSDKFFLVSCNPAGRYNDETAYGIYLLDAFGNRVPIYRDPEISCWQPMPLRPREKPPVLPSVNAAAKKGTGLICAKHPPGRSGKLAPSPFSPAMATVFLNDVYRGLEGIEPGTVKYLRVMEQIPKPWAAEVDPLRGEDRSADGFGGHIAVTMNAHIWIAVLQGIVPVEEDGSACFEVPAGRNLFFQALDKDFMEVQRMRTFVSFEPGEKRSCIGCHEHRTQAPVSRVATAFGRPPAKLAAQPGETAPRPLHYPTDVQPIFDRHCVSCHNGRDPKTPLDLRGDLTTFFNRSYENIFQAGLVDTIREWAGATYSMENAEAVPPYSHGSHRSKLVDALKKGHYDAELSREEWIKLVTWIDCGAPYYGSYYGRRNLAYRGQPDFRPVPTVESACGIPPEFPELPKADPLPAKLLAWWPLDEAPGGTVPDASGNGRNGEIVGAEWAADGPERRVPNFMGKSYVSAGGLGRREAVSVSLWLKPDSVPNRWNPLLFSDGSSRGALHFSLLDDGTPNVAINSAPGSWTHRRAATALAVSQWHHLVVSCDPRYGGSIRFYLDGKRDSEQALGLGVAPDLSSFRLGAWKSWESNPKAGFHGLLDEVRVYHGTLTDRQVADLFAAGRTNTRMARSTDR